MIVKLLTKHLYDPWQFIIIIFVLSLRFISIVLTSEKMMLILRLIRESYLFAFSEIIVNKVRTILSLLGITIGIFCIISVFTIFDSMEIAIHKSIDSLGTNVLFIEKWPWAMGGDYPWWKYLQRPEGTLEDMKEIQKRRIQTELAL